MLLVPLLVAFSLRISPHGSALLFSHFFLPYVCVYMCVSFRQKQPSAAIIGEGERESGHTCSSGGGKRGLPHSRDKACPFGHPYDYCRPSSLAHPDALKLNALGAQSCGQSSSLTSYGRQHSVPAHSWRLTRSPERATRAPIPWPPAIDAGLHGKPKGSSALDRESDCLPVVVVAGRMKRGNHERKARRGVHRSVCIGMCIVVCIGEIGSSVK